MDHTAIYSIGAVARMVRISPSTLRTWEERYGVISPHRSGGGHRLYTRDQVEQLRFVASRVEEGLSAADAHRLLADRLDTATEGGSHGRGVAGPPLVLLVEHDRFAARYAEDFLRSQGYEVVLAESPRDARRLLDARAPAVTVVDLMVSGGEGMALCRSLRESGSQAPILAVSTLGWGEDALSAGADAFLQKPLDPFRLVSAVQGLLGSDTSTEAGARAS